MQVAADIWTAVQFRKQGKSYLNLSRILSSDSMHYYIGSDHAGFNLKELIKENLKGKYKFEDIGTFSATRVDYGIIAMGLAKKVAAEKDAMGILICGTGIGMSIVANKIPGIRAALIYDGFTAKMARNHNNANIACLGARNISPQDAISIIDTFLAASFAGKKKGGERHKKRVEQISAIEKEHFKENTIEKENLKKNIIEKEQAKPKETKKGFSLRNLFSGGKKV